MLFGIGGDDVYQFTGALPSFATISEASGGGTDILNFSKLLFSVGVDLEEEFLVDVGALSVAYDNATDRAIENVIGTAHDDWILGNDLANRLEGGDGMDTLEGRLGNDELIGGDGDDYYTFAGSVNLGDDTMTELPGEGHDTLDFEDFDEAGVDGVTVDLNLAQMVNGTNVDVFDDTQDNAFEGIIGTDDKDTLIGNASDNHLDGLGGTDTIEGRDGNDSMIGTDMSTFYGGDGYDTPELVDNDPSKESQFDASGAWSVDTTSGALNGWQYTASGSGNTAEWLFEGASAPPTTGTFGVYATWFPVAGGADTGTPFTVTDSAGSFSQSYGVDFSQAPGGANSVMVAGRVWQLLHVQSNLTNGVQVKLDAGAANGKTVIADGVMVLPDPLPPPMSPTNLRQNANQLRWNRPADTMMLIDTFEIQRSKTGLGDWELWLAGIDPATTRTNTATDPVTQQETYFYRIRSLSVARGNSDWSEILDRPNGLEDLVVKTRANVTTSPPRIELEWVVQRNHLASKYDVERKLRGESEWTSMATDLTVPMPNIGSMTWTDAVPVGSAYEYRVTRKPAIGDPPMFAEGYLFAGLDRPVQDLQGQLLLVVDENVVTELDTEIDRLKDDLVREGWDVIQIDIDPDPESLGEDSGLAVSNVKEAIKEKYDQEPNVTAVLLLGNIPVPFSGYHRPDSHALRTLPADSYYGDVDAALIANPLNEDWLISDGWTDDSTMLSPTPNLPDGSVTNVPGDGRFDDETIPDGVVELMIGRIDMSKMGDFGSDFSPPLSGHDLEVALLKRYLDKDHNFRTRSNSFANVITEAAYIDPFNQSGRVRNLQNFTALVGHENLTRVNWLKVGEDTPYLFASVDSNTFNQFSINVSDGVNEPGGEDTLTFIEDFVPTQTQTVFHAFSASFSINWDKTNVFMRGLIANDGHGLTAQWNQGDSEDSLLTTWHMALGETIGFANQNSGLPALPNNSPPPSGRPTWRDLLGDPTLRMHYVEPASNVSVSGTPGNVTISWTASSDPGDIVGYHVYRASSSDGPFSRVTTEPVVGMSAFDDAGSPTDTYMVRAIKREVTPSGTYFNASRGVLSSD